MHILSTCVLLACLVNMCVNIVLFGCIVSMSCEKRFNISCLRVLHTCLVTLSYPFVSLGILWSCLVNICLSIRYCCLVSISCEQIVQYVLCVCLAHMSCEVKLYFCIFGYLVHLSCDPDVLSACLVNICLNISLFAVL